MTGAIDPEAVSLPWHLMPESLREMAEVCGEAATLALLTAFRGRTVRIPLSPGGNTLLESRLPAEYATVICQHYGGISIAVPTAKAASIALIHAAIWRAFYVDKRRAVDIAQEFGYTSRQISNITGKTLEEILGTNGAQAKGAA